MKLLRTALIVMGAGLLLSACGEPQNSDQSQVASDASSSQLIKAHGKLKTLKKAGNLAAIKDRGQLVIATRNAPTSVYIDQYGNLAGPEHDLAAAFAKSLGVSARFLDVRSVKGMLAAVADGKADIAAGSITETTARQQRFSFGPSYKQVSQEVVCNNKNKARKIADLAKVSKIVVAADTSYAERLREINQQQPALEINWQESENLGTEQLFAEVAKGNIGCTIADSNIVAINRRYHPSLLVMFSISSPQNLAWPMPQQSDKLRAAATAWLKSYRGAGKLTALDKTYYGMIGKWDFVDKKTLVDRTENAYPKYDNYFTKAAKSHDFDKWLLAAQGYQESHWRPDATSHTGVRGIMMLTQNTAKEMGVSDRLDPKQSIMGGAAYLRMMEKKLPDEIVEPDRYYFALAAYNIGFYHLRDAMTLAKRANLDPYSWSDVKEVLPQLMEKQHYSTVKYGYARGTEPVRYVERIRDYSDVIRHITKTD